MVTRSTEQREQWMFVAGLLFFAVGCSGTDATPATRQDSGAVRTDASADASGSFADAGPVEAGRADAPEASACVYHPAKAGSSFGSPVEVPFTVSPSSSDGAMRFGVPVQIGDTAPVEMMLDTGSSGLRILRGTVPDEAFACVTSTPVSYSYHSGLLISGVVAYATLTLGGVTTPTAIPVMRIDSVSCSVAKPNCGAADATPADAHLFGSFKAVLGIGMRNSAEAAAVASPIAQLAGTPSFVVQAPSYGGTSGTLSIAPSAAARAKFKTFDLPTYAGAPLANGAPTYDDRYGLPACVDDATTGVNYCVPAELDTGNPPLYVEWAAQTSGDLVLAAGNEVHVVVGPASAPLGTYSFDVGSVPTPGVDEVVIEPASAQPFMNLGTGVFFRYDVLFDQAHGIVGLAPH